MSEHNDAIEMKTKTMLGPCCVCGAYGYRLSCGGPSICPKCDCGDFDSATVFHQAKVIEQLRAELAKAKSPTTEPSAEEVEAVAVDTEYGLRKSAESVGAAILRLSRRGK